MKLALNCPRLISLLVASSHWCLIFFLGIVCSVGFINEITRHTDDIISEGNTNFQSETGSISDNKIRRIIFIGSDLLSSSLLWKDE